MFNATQVLIDAFVGQLNDGYKKTYGGYKQNYCEIIAWAASISLEIISNTNALYHNVEHTVLVTLVGQEILKGLHIKKGGVTAEIWLNVIISLLFHDIGMVRGICQEDEVENRIFATGKNNEKVKFDRGKTDASLAPYHVDRGKLFIEERFGNHSIINAKQIKSNIELTRFPIPKERKNVPEFSFAELVRAADLIGQLGDHRYINKTTALFYEFQEIGANEKLGYTTPDHLVKNYPKFFWNAVFKFIQPALKFLQLTVKGKFYVASLYANVFMIEHLAQIETPMIRMPTDKKKSEESPKIKSDESPKIKPKRSFSKKKKKLKLKKSFTIDCKMGERKDKKDKLYTRVNIEFDEKKKKKK